MLRDSRVSLSALLLALAVPLLSNCQAARGAMGKAGELGGGPKCPDLSADALLAYDFAGNFKLKPESAMKAKAGLVGAVEINGIAAQIDADLKAGCGGLAKDLGAQGDFADGKAACEAAVKAMGDIKGKIGANAKFALNVKPPVCSANIDAAADCAGKCDAKVSGGKAKVECEPGKLSGSCSAQCEGSCDLQAAAKCEGECNGSCDAEIKGSCSGKCNGKCDGKTSTGASCAGVCEGKCEGGSVQAECKGKCGGSCKLKAAAKCEGTCTGKCSAEMKAPKCTGDIKPPEASAECKASCDAHVSAKAQCTPAQVGLAVSGGADLKAVEQYKMAIEKNLPLVAKVAVGMKDRAARVATEVQAAAEGGISVGKELVDMGGTQGAMLGGQFTACFSEAFKGVGAAAGKMQANVDVSVKVQASASASGSASTK